VAKRTKKKRQRPVDANTRDLDSRDQADSESGSTAASTRRSTSSRSGRLKWAILGIVVSAVMIPAGIWAWDRHVRWQMKQAMSSRRFSEAERWSTRGFWSPTPVRQTLLKARIARLRMQPLKAELLLDEADETEQADADVDREMKLLAVQMGSPLGPAESQRLLNENPDDTDAVFEAWVLGRLTFGDFESARRLLEQWRRVEPDSALASYLFGQYHDLKDDNRHAEAAFARAVRLDGRFDRARLGWARSLYRLDRLKEAGAVADELLARDGNDADGLLLKSRILVDLEQFDQAIKLTRRALNSVPTLYDARFLLGKSLLAQGRHAEAIETLSPILDRFAEDNATLYLLAEAHKESGNEDEHRQFVRRYLDAQREIGRLYTADASVRRQGSSGVTIDPSVLRDIGMRYVRVDWKSARDWLMRYSAQAPDDREVLETLALIDESLGELAVAEDARLAATEG